MVRFDSTSTGTSATEWGELRESLDLPELDLSTLSRVCVIAAHPDDETLGAGGLIAECARRGLAVQLIVVTDGSASHPDSPTLDRRQLAAIRQRELYTAIAELAPQCEITMLGFPDGETDNWRIEIGAALRQHISAGATLVAPWHGDGHRDHRVVAELCAEIARERRVKLLEYPIWMWHWAGPTDDRVPWQSAVSLALGHVTRSAKRRALARHVSQVVGLGSEAGNGPVLGPTFLANFDQDSEVFLIPSHEPVETRSKEYFDALYASNADPWRLSSRWYEERKRAITIASLPRRRYASGLEIGSSVGELTAALAERCDALLAVDISEAAVAASAQRTAEFPGVRVEIADATSSFPDGRFDLVVLSEVAYYWSRDALRGVLADLTNHLTDDANVVACHWRHTVADYPLGGNEVHDIIRSELGMTSLVVHSEEDFLLEVFSVKPGSVARREGFLS